MKQSTKQSKIKSLKLVVFMLLISFSIQAQTYSEQEINTKQTVDKFFEYVTAKNPEKIASMVSENVDWYIFESKYMPWTGHRTKRAEVAALFKTLFSYFIDGSEKLEAKSFLLQGNEVAVFGTIERTVKKTGKRFKMPLAIHLTVENNLIRKFTIYEETLIIEKAFQ